MRVEFLILSFAAGVAAGLWIAVVCRPKEKEEEMPVDPTERAEWWQRGEECPPWDGD